MEDPLLGFRLISSGQIPFELTVRYPMGGRSAKPSSRARTSTRHVEPAIVRQSTAATRHLLVVTIASTSIFRWKWMRSEGGRRQILCDSLEWMGMRPKGWPLALKLADMPAWHRQLLLNLSSSSLLRSYNRGFKSFDRFSIFVRFCCSGEANDLSRDRMNHILALLEYFFQEATEGFFLLRTPKSALSW